MAIGNTDSKTKLAVFLGSGFSAALGLPTTNQLSGKLLEPGGDNLETKAIEEFISTRISAFWENVFGWRPGMPRPTLEDHFTQIDMAANSGHRLGPSFGPSELRATRRMTIHRIFSLLKTLGFQADCVTKFLKELSKTHDLALITSNWDAEVESSLEGLQIPFMYGDENGSAAESATPFQISVLKLHGCISRAYCDCCRDVIRLRGMSDPVKRLGLLLHQKDFELFDGSEEPARLLTQRQRNHFNSKARACPRCGAPLSLRVGTFSYRKDLNTLYSIWDNARDSLKLAEKWLLVGYSLPEADIEIRHLLKAAQLARRDSSRLSIEVVLKEDPCSMRAPQAALWASE